MDNKDKRNVVLLLLLLWMLKPEETVTSDISFPQSPDGFCYDPVTGSYYVGDC